MTGQTQTTSRRNAPPAADLSGITDSLRPITAERFGFDEARHLLMRAGFGGTPDQIAALAALGPERAVDYLVSYDDIPFEAVSADLFDRNIMRPYSEEERRTAQAARRSSDEDSLARLRARRQEAQRTDRQQLGRIQRWWLKRMIETPRPLEEKMTLFWHGHFATGYRTIEDSYHMFLQNQTFRQRAVGNFGELMFAIIRDPAMLKYLDNDESRKGKPNENLARELMELFGLGVGNYTENDIKEGARALTGYSFDDDAFVFRDRDHDGGNKRILGRSGDMNGDDFVRAILEKRECSRFIAGKLYRYFALDDAPSNPELAQAADSVSRELAGDLLRARYEVRPVLRKLFLSEHFYSAPVRGERIKSPAELVVGAVRTLLTPTRDLGMLVDAMNMMGQHLLQPPSVAGWAGGRSWINTSTLFVRQNTLCFLLTGRGPQGVHPLADEQRYDPTPLLASLGKAGDSASPDPEQLVDYLLRFALGRSSERAAKTLLDFVAHHGGRTSPEIVTGLLLLITAMPEYQTC